jgi:hypothetical protein
VFYNDEYHMRCPTFENNSYCCFDIYFIYFLSILIRNIFIILLLFYLFLDVVEACDIPENPRRREAILGGNERLNYHELLMNCCEGRDFWDIQSRSIGVKIIAVFLYFFSKFGGLSYMPQVFYLSLHI